MGPPLQVGIYSTNYGVLAHRISVFSVVVIFIRFFLFRTPTSQVDRVARSTA